MEIVPEYLKWDQEKLFKAKNNTQKSRDTLPLKGLSHEMEGVCCYTYLESS